MLSTKELEEIFTLVDTLEGEKVEWVPRYSMDAAYSLLKNEVIKRIFLGECDDSLVFQTENKLIRMDVSSECCSESWVADFFGFDKLEGSPIIGIEKLNLNVGVFEKLHESRQESDCIYGLRFCTVKGNAVMSFRNSSNGYYGGEVETITEIEELKGYTQILPNDKGFWMAD